MKLALTKKAQPHDGVRLLWEDAWNQLVRFRSSGFSDTARLDELFDHTGTAA